MVNRAPWQPLSEPADMVAAPGRVKVALPPAATALLADRVVVVNVTPVVVQVPAPPEAVTVPLPATVTTRTGDGLGLVTVSFTSPAAPPGKSRPLGDAPALTG